LIHLWLLLVVSLLQVGCASSGSNKAETAPAQNTVVHKPEQEQIVTAPKQLANEVLSQSVELAKLEAQIAKQQIEFSKRPRRVFVGARPQEYRYALYIENWRKKIEKVGNENYPKEAKEQKLYGQVQLTVSILPDGSVEKVAVNKSSGYRVLDEAAERIVQLAAPFDPFPADIHKDTDILSITRTWTFTKEDISGSNKQTSESQTVEK
jgi:protein TonB